VENRPVNVFKLGSMSARNIEETFPGLCRISSSILDAHHDSKGIIHCHSYKLGDRLYAYFSGTPHGHRIIYPDSSSKRRAALERHMRNGEPTVLLSPSISEGYSFDDDLARFQIITKMPFPDLRDHQVAAREQQDPEWYTLQTVMSIIQACGRSVRSDTDFAHTYILDSDFVWLTEKNPHFFPKWFTKAFKYVK
jgi:Rad3-related DNA helicase